MRKSLSALMLALLALLGAAASNAQTVEPNVTGLWEKRSETGQPAIRFGLALHVGEVLYGNIGGADRLDFTVIGQAVNVASRIENLTKTLGRQILFSGDFAELCRGKGEALGTFPLKGVGAERPVYALTMDGSP